VRDPDQWAYALDAARPDLVLHLAGIAHVPTAGRDAGLVTDVNVGGTARLLAALRERRASGVLDPTVLLVGSGEQYGRHDAAELPLAETAEQRPLTAYGASKQAQEAVALQAARADGLRVVLTRSFNHSGAGQAPSFLLPGLVARALQLRAAGGRTLAMGNQDAVRDFLHVRDVVAAYILLADRGVTGEVYNVCSGRGWSTGDLARRVLARVGVDAPVVSDPSLVRPVDVPALVGDNAKLRAATGWAPTLGLDDIIEDLIRSHAATH
jgi:GDP-4-dehydro-6-deoxy-D-mannose reductase